MTSYKSCLFVSILVLRLRLPSDYHASSYQDFGKPPSTPIRTFGSLRELRRELISTTRLRLKKGAVTEEDLQAKVEAYTIAANDEINKGYKASPKKAGTP